jgi:hypothetical protein
MIGDIRCVQQLGFLKLWQLRYEAGQIPQLKSFPLDDLSRSIDKIMFCTVEQGEAGFRFRIVHEGPQFVRMHQASCVGRYLDEAIVPAVREKGLKCYEDVVATRRPSFSRSIVQKKEGPEIYYERLLLPFSRKGPFVYGIACMVSLFTEANGFNFGEISSPELVAVG